MSLRSPAGVINVLKPPGATSHDIVAQMRRILGERRVGHGGTLDPGAAGVLPVLVGKATKLMPYLQQDTKAYRAEMTLGVTTESQDAAGQTVDVALDFAVKPITLGDVMHSFIGEIEQIPPMTSAVHHEGKRLYELARAGVEVERRPRKATIGHLSVHAVLPAGSDTLVAGTRVVFDVVCSKGTYIRTLCHDIGAALGCGAHMSFLVRTRAGSFHLADSLTPGEVREAVQAGEIERVVVPPAEAAPHLPAFEVAPDDAVRLRQGQACPVSSGEFESPPSPGDTVRVLDARGLVCIGRVATDGGILSVRPVRVL